jgi:hypothetical protein
VGKAMERIGKFIISDFQKGIRLGFLKSFFWTFNLQKSVGKYWSLNNSTKLFIFLLVLYIKIHVNHFQKSSLYHLIFFKNWFKNANLVNLLVISLLIYLNTFKKLLSIKVYKFYRTF